MAGDVAGKAGDGAVVGEGGIKLQVNGVDQGVRPDVNYEDSIGVRWTAADNPGQNRVDVSAELDAEILLSHNVSLNMIPGGINQSIAPASTPFTLARITRILFIAQLINDPGGGVQPTVRVGTDVTTPDNVAGAAGGGSGNQALGFTAALQLREIDLRNDPRASLVPANALLDDLILDQVGAATGFTDYLVSVQVWGIVVTP